MYKIPFVENGFITDNYEVFINGLKVNDFKLKIKDKYITDLSLIYLYSLFEIDKYGFKNKDLEYVHFIKIKNKLLLNKNNYIMVFKKPIIGAHGYLIPGIPQMYISKDYVLYYSINNVPRQKDLKSKLNKVIKDYPTVYIHNIKNDIKIHRLVALAMLPFMDDKKLFINHKDGNKFNFHVKNLEWVSIGENNIHAVEAGLTKVGLNIIVYDTKFKNSAEFKSMSSFLRSLNIDYKNKRLNYYVNNPSLLYLNRYAIFTKEFYNKYKLKFENKSTKRKSIIFNIYENNELIRTVYGTRELIKMFNITSDKYYNLIDKIEKRNPHIKIEVINKFDIIHKSKKPNKSYLIKLINQNTNEEIIFKSLRSISKYLGVDRSVIKNRLKNNKPYKHFIIKPVNNESY